MLREQRLKTTQIPFPLCSMPILSCSWGSVPCCLYSGMKTGSHYLLQCHCSLWHGRTVKQKGTSSSPISLAKASGEATLSIRRVGKLNSAICSEGTKLEIFVNSINWKQPELVKESGLKFKLHNVLTV